MNTKEQGLGVGDWRLQKAESRRQKAEGRKQEAGVLNKGSRRPIFEERIGGRIDNAHDTFHRTKDNGPRTKDEN